MVGDQGDLFPEGPFFRWESETVYCADCGEDTIMIGEWYMVTNEVWERAWGNDPRAGWGKILCIGCLEKRIGRRLMACDFTDAPVNNPFQGAVSERMFNRLSPSPKSGNSGDHGPSCY
jgi:hypothetical protein